MRNSFTCDTVFSRRSIVHAVTGAAVALLMALLVVPAAQAAPTAADFVSDRVNDGVAILGNKGLAEPERRSQFRNFILGLVDERRIALFTLGKYRRDADDQTLNDFVAAFTDYSVAVYESRLGQYSGQKLKVTDTLERSATDIVVTTVLEGDTGPDPINVAFRLAKEGDEFTVVDIQVVGIWLAIDQQSQFSSFLAQKGGNVASLTADLRQRTADIRAGKAQQ